IGRGNGDLRRGPIRSGSQSKDVPQDRLAAGTTAGIPVPVLRRSGLQDAGPCLPGPADRGPDAPELHHLDRGAALRTSADQHRRRQCHRRGGVAGAVVPARLRPRAGEAPRRRRPDAVRPVPVLGQRAGAHLRLDSDPAARGTAQPAAERARTDRHAPAAGAEPARPGAGPDTDPDAIRRASARQRDPRHRLEPGAGGGKPRRRADADLREDPAAAVLARHRRGKLHRVHPLDGRLHHAGPAGRARRHLPRPADRDAGEHAPQLGPGGGAVGDAACHHAGAGRPVPGGVRDARGGAAVTAAVARRRRGSWGRLWLWCAAGIAMLFLAAPTLIVVPLSLSSSSFLTFPPPGWSTRWYAQLFESLDWTRASLTSLQVGLGTTACATVLGTCLALGFRTAFPGRDILRAFVLSPLLVPGIVLAIAYYIFFSVMSLEGVRLLDSVTGLIIAHSTITIPFVVVTVTASLANVDLALIRAAESLGASPSQTFWRVIFPLIRPGIATG